MSLGAVRTLYEHHWWANRTLVDTTARLGEAKAAQEIGSQFSEPSLKRMFFHVFGVDGLWLARWQGVSPTSIRVINYRLLSGKAYRQPLGLLLHHVPDHGTHHRSEIATMLTMVSGSPPGTGLARFIAIRSGQESP
jgi:uncharacterized damage-inducible protein DinB